MGCLTPGTTWRFHAYGKPYHPETGMPQVGITLFITPPTPKLGQVYDYPVWYKHGWEERLSAAQVDELRDAVHEALEPIIARWQGNPEAPAGPKTPRAADEDQAVVTVDLARRL